MTMMKTLLVLIALLQSASSLIVKTGRVSSVGSQIAVPSSRLCMSAESDADMHRRSFLFTVGQVLPAAAAFSYLSPALADDGNSKIVVFGGSGYVGAHVGQILSKKGYKVVSVSRSSPSDQADKVQKILGTSIPVDYVSLDASSADLSGVLKDAGAVVSCVGIAPGGANQRAGNGAVNVRIAEAAKAAGVGRFVYISVASDLANGPAKFLLGDYFKGKAEAEAAVVKDFGPNNSLVVKPAIIEGGPPGEIRPPGPPGMKPASVEAVARAVVAGATGAMTGSIDGNDAISAL